MYLVFLSYTTLMQWFNLCQTPRIFIGRKLNGWPPVLKRNFSSLNLGGRMSMIIFMNSRPKYFICLIIALHWILANSEIRRYKSQVFFYSKIGKTLDFLVDSTWDGDIFGNSLEGGHIWVPWVCGLLLWSLIFGVFIIYSLYVSSRRLTKLGVSFWEFIPK